MDIQFVQFSDTLQISSVMEIPDFRPRTFRITGFEFQNAISVLINGDKSPSFVVSSSRVILAQVPTSAKDEAVSEVIVLSAEYTADLKSMISFEFGDSPKKATGSKYLIQTFLRMLMTTPGFDAFRKNLGGGMLLAISGRSDGTASPDTVATVSRSVSRATEQLVALQARQLRLADDERLVKTDLTELRYDPQSTSLVARVVLTSQAGTTSVANLEL
jgi:hypothetical protein